MAFVVAECAAHRAESVRMPIRQWITDERDPAIDPIAWWTLLLPSIYLPTISALGFVAWRFDNRGPDIEGVIHFDLRNTGREKAHY